MQEVGIMSEDRLQREENMLNQAKEKLEKARAKFERDKETLEQDERLKQEKELKQEESRLKQRENMLNQIKENIKRRKSMFELLSYEPFEKYKPFKVCKNEDNCNYLKDCKNPEECDYFEESIDPENCKNSNKCKYFQECKNHEECKYFEYCKSPNKCKYFQECEYPERDFVRSVLNGSCDCTGNTKYEELFKGFYEERRFIHSVLSDSSEYKGDVEYEKLFDIFHKEKEFIRSILNGTCDYKNDEYYKKIYETFCEKRGDWLATWIKQYHKNKKEEYPILLKKICYYYMVKHDCTRADISNALGITLQSASNLLNKWNLYIDYRKASEDCKEIKIPIERRGKKKHYLIEFIQKAYYESRRKTINEDRLSRLEVEKLYDDETSDTISIATQDKEISASVVDLPVFVDIFGGTGIVASSMNVDSAYKVVNDFDPTVIATLYALLYYPDEFLEKFKRFNIDIIKGYYEKLIHNIPAKDFTDGVGRVTLVYYTDNNLNTIKMPKNNPFSQQKLQLLKLIRNAWFYSQYALFGKSDSAEKMRDLSGMHFYDKDKPHTPAVRDKILEVACYFIYYHRKPTLSSGEPDYRNYGENEHYNLLEEYFDFTKQNITDKVAYFLDPTNLENIPVNKDFLKEWRAGLQDAIIGKKSFEEVFPANVEQQVKKVGVEVADMAKRTFYYLDSPYFMTKDYALTFNDEMHKIMLDNLRGSEFDWMFSIQYKTPDTYNTKPPKNSGIKKIPSYGSYYYGFVAEYEKEVDEDGFYKSTYDPKKADEYRELYVILQELENKKKNVEEGDNLPRIEIFITTVDMRRYTPYGNEFIQLSMKKFLEYVHATYDATNTIRRANNSLIKSYNAPNANPYKVNFCGSYGDVYYFAKTEYEKELTP